MKGEDDLSEIKLNYDYSKLRGKIKEVLKTEGKFAEAIGRTHNFLTKVWNGDSYFSQNDICNGAEALGIQPEEIGLYFFTRKVNGNVTSKSNYQTSIKKEKKQWQKSLSMRTAI